MRANLVGRSVVSAITQTPASAPFALVTTPPMSSLSMRTAPLLCSPPIRAVQAAIPAATIAANKLKYKVRFLLIHRLLSSMSIVNNAIGTFYKQVARVMELFHLVSKNEVSCQLD